MSLKHAVSGALGNTQRIRDTTPVALVFGEQVIEVGALNDFQRGLSGKDQVGVLCTGRGHFIFRCGMRLRRLSRRRQVPAFDDGSVNRHDEGALNHIAQFAYIAWPVVAL